MSSESHSIDSGANTGGSQDNTACPNCRAQMPQGMRFCRLCGFRLGEGVEEFTETVRLGAPHPGRPATAANGAQRTPFSAHEFGAMSQAGASQVALGKRKRKSKGPHWIVWVILAIVIASVAGGSFIRPLKFNIGKGGAAGAGTGQSGSKVGASDFSSMDGGAMIEAITPPDGPMDKAGLIGGDIIRSFDGKPVQGEDELRKVIAATPVGKTVEVVYTRDGEAKTTKLTTVNEDELEKLDEIADNLPNGFFGIDGLERVAVPNTNIYGVRVGRAIRNRPAYTSGLRDGDIIIQLGDIPIRTAEELGGRINRSTPDSTVKVTVMRGDTRMEIPVMVGVD